MEALQSRIHLILYSVVIKLHRPRFLPAWEDDDPNVWAVLQHVELYAENM